MSDTELARTLKYIKELDAQTHAWEQRMVQMRNELRHDRDELIRHAVAIGDRGTKRELLVILNVSQQWLNTIIREGDDAYRRKIDKV